MPEWSGKDKFRKLLSVIYNSTQFSGYSVDVDISLLVALLNHEGYNKLIFKIVCDGGFCDVVVRKIVCFFNFIIFCPETICLLNFLVKCCQCGGADFSRCGELFSQLSFLFARTLISFI